MPAVLRHSPSQSFALAQDSIVESVRATCQLYDRGEIDVFDAEDVIENVLKDVYNTEMSVFGKFRLPDALQRLDAVASVPLHYALGCLRRSMERNGTLPTREPPSLTRRPHRRVPRSPSGASSVYSAQAPSPVRSPLAPTNANTPELACRVAARYGCTIRLWLVDRMVGAPRTFRPAFVAPTSAPIDLLYSHERYQLVRSGSQNPGDRLPPVLAGPGPGRGLPMLLMFALNAGNLQGMVIGLGRHGFGDALLRARDGGSAPPDACATFRQMLMTCWFQGLGLHVSDMERLCDPDTVPPLRYVPQLRHLSLPDQPSVKHDR